MFLTLPSSSPTGRFARCWVSHVKLHPEEPEEPHKLRLLDFVSLFHIINIFVGTAVVNLSIYFVRYLFWDSEIPLVLHPISFQETAAAGSPPSGGVRKI